MGSGKFKYIELNYSISDELNNPLKVIKNNWNSLLDGLYIAAIKCGSAHTAIIQRVSNGNYGVIYCFDYTASELTPCILEKFSNSWIEEKVITHSDLFNRFLPIKISGYSGDTFKSVLKNKFNSAVNFITFASNTENPITDNPFSFTVGYAIVFHASFINSENIFTLIGTSSSTQPQIEARRLDLNS